MKNFLKIIKRLLKPKKRGYIYVEAMGGGLINKGIEYKGNYSVIISGETPTTYEIKFVDLPIYEKEWVDKKLVTITRGGT